MEAANRGACEAGGISVGLGIELPFEQGLNQLRRPRRQLPLLLRPQDDVRQVRPGFVVLPGGFGTLDELFEALTLVQTRKVTRFPVVLFGTAYWGGLLDWLRQTAAEAGTISAADLDLLHLTDDVDEAVQIVRAAPNKVVAERPE